MVYISYRNQLKISDSRIPTGTTIKIVQLSDLHFTIYGIKEDRILDAVKKTNPDIIVMTGDYIQSKKDITPLELFLKKLREKFENIAILVILGNWDFKSGSLSELIKTFKKYNVVVLNDTFKTLTVKHTKITFMGFNSIQYDYNLNINILDRLPRDSINIVLIHEPVLSNVILQKRKDIKLILAGHCHGGQIKIFGKYIFLPEGCEIYPEGLYKVNNTVIYTSRGLGTSIYPIRFMSPPEIVVINLEKS